MNFHDVLIVSDYDWTLTDSNHTIPEENLKAIRYFTENGGAFTLGSGRGVTMLEDIISSIPVNAPCVLSNGAVLYDYSKKKLLSLKGFSEDDTEKLIRMTDIMSPDMCMMVESGIYDYYMPEEIAERFDIGNADEKEMDEESRWVLHEIVRPNTLFVPMRQIPKPWVKAAVFGNDEDMAAVKAWCEKNGLFGQKSAKSLYELMPSGINKGTGARNLLNILGRKVLVCIGDEENDLKMLEEADYGFVTLSAKENMKNRGFYLCASNDEGAVSDVIRQLELL